MMPRRAEDYESDPQIQLSLAELRALILARFPQASLGVFAGDDPEGVYLRVVIDVEPDDVLDVVIDRLLEMQIEEGLPIYVVVAGSPGRIAEQLRKRPSRERFISPPLP